MRRSPRATGVTLDDVEQVLAAMKGLEPIGIGSRSITESLLAQIEYLRERGRARRSRTHAEEVVGEHLADLGERRFREAAAAVGVTQREVDRRLGVREGQPQPVSDRGLHRGGERRRARERSSAPTS